MSPDTVRTIVALAALVAGLLFIGLVFVGCAGMSNANARRGATAQRHRQHHDMVQMWNRLPEILRMISPPASGPEDSHPAAYQDPSDRLARELNGANLRDRFDAHGRTYSDDTLRGVAGLLDQEESEVQYVAGAIARVSSDRVIRDLRIMAQAFERVTGRKVTVSVAPEHPPVEEADIVGRIGPDSQPAAA